MNGTSAGRHRGSSARDGYLITRLGGMEACRRYDLSHCPVCSWSHRLVRPCDAHQYQGRHRRTDGA